jgi:thiamine pyrophosphate-dependent acetolactate synthase large subunit-like protein
MVASITKYAVIVRDAADIRYHLQRALNLTLHARSGHVLLEAVKIALAALRAYAPAKDA